MKNPLQSTKFVAALLCSILSAVCIGVFGLDLTTTAVIVSPLAAYIPFRAISDLKGHPFTEDQVKRLLELAAGSTGGKPPAGGDGK